MISYWLPVAVCCLMARCVEWFEAQDESDE